MLEKREKEVLEKLNQKIRSFGLYLYRFVFLILWNSWYAVHFTEKVRLED